MTRKTYWEGKGQLQVVYDELMKLIPPAGTISRSRYAIGTISGSRNRHLERLRKASISYYDLFDNSGFYYGRSIEQTFGLILRDHRHRIQARRPDGSRLWLYAYDWEAIHEVVEPIMDQLIINAADEQIPEWQALLLQPSRN